MGNNIGNDCHTFEIYRKYNILSNIISTYIFPNGIDTEKEMKLTGDIRYVRETCKMNLKQREKKKKYMETIFR